MSFQISGKVWPNGTIPYELANDLSDPKAVMEAITEIENLTHAVKFKIRTNETDYVSVVNGDDHCSSRTGMQGGKQELKLVSGCTAASAIHEWMHVLGFTHEQDRYDRNQFVTILTKNILQGKGHNFDIPSQGTNVVPPADNAYDFESIMHYSATAFGQPANSVTIQCKDTFSEYQDVIGNSKNLSTGDIEGVRERYNGNDFGKMTIVNNTTENIYYALRWGDSKYVVGDTLIAPGESATYKDSPNSQFGVFFKKDNKDKTPLIELDWVDIASVVEISNEYIAKWETK